MRPRSQKSEEHLVGHRWNLHGDRPLGRWLATFDVCLAVAAAFDTPLDGGRVVQR